MGDNLPGLCVKVILSFLNININVSDLHDYLLLFV